MITILNQNSISYQIVGGLAAKTYGATRDLIDIDIYVSGHDFHEACRLCKSHLVWGPEVWKDSEWDCEFAKFEFEGQKLEIGNSDNTRRFDTEENDWVDEYINYHDFELQVYLDTPITVIPKEKLIEYKRKLNREVDLIDIKQMGNCIPLDTPVSQNPEAQ